MQNILDQWVPVILGVLVAGFAWMLKQIIECGHWRAGHEAESKAHIAMADRAFRDSEKALEVAVQHGDEMNRIRKEVEGLSNKLSGFFEGLETRLMSFHKELNEMKTTCRVHLTALAEHNGLNLPDEQD